MATKSVWTTGGELALGDCLAYHHVFSRTPWNLRLPAQTLARILIVLVPDEWVVVAVDDTACGRKGEGVTDQNVIADLNRGLHVGEHSVSSSSPVQRGSKIKRLILNAGA